MLYECPPAITTNNSNCMNAVTVNNFIDSINMWINMLENIYSLQLFGFVCTTVYVCLCVHACMCVVVCMYVCECIGAKPFLFVCFYHTTS